MAYENSGRLFKNDHKDLNDPNDKKPDYTGDFTDEHGKKWRCAAWIKPGERGKWMSFKISEAQQRQEPTGGDQAQQGPNTGGGETAPPDSDDSIPFATPWGIR